MDVIIEEHGKAFTKTLHARIAEIRRRLGEMSSRKDADSLLALAEALLVYSHSHILLKLSVDDLLEWLRAFHGFLRQRDGDVKVCRFDPENSTSSFLLVNTPDVPYLVDSLKNILRRLPYRAMIISHPILPVTRSCF